MYEYSRGHVRLEKGFYSKETLDKIIQEVIENEGPAYESALDIFRLSGGDTSKLLDTNEYGLDLKATEGLCEVLVGGVRIGEVEGKMNYLHVEDVPRRVCGLEAIASKLHFASELGLAGVS